MGKYAFCLRLSHTRLIYVPFGLRLVVYIIHLVAVAKIASMAIVLPSLMFVCGVEIGLGSQALLPRYKFYGFKSDDCTPDYHSSVEPSFISQFAIV